MVGNTALKQESELRPVGGNNVSAVPKNQSGSRPMVLRPANTSETSDNKHAVLTKREVHPLAIEGTRRLISHHTSKTPVLIKSWGTPEAVYAEVRNSLISFGYQIGMAEEMAEKLVEHAINHSDASRQKYGANIIALKIEVSKEKPQPQFGTGALEVQRIDGQTNQAQVAGATTVAIGINTGGTFTTALRDSVTEIMQAMAGASQAVWISFEAPDKSELQGVANDIAMAAMAGLAGGSLSPDMIAELQSFVEMDILSPDIMGVLEQLYQLQVTAVSNDVPTFQNDAKSLMEQLSELLKNSDVNSEIITTAVNAIQFIADKNDLNSAIDMKDVIALKLEIISLNLEEVDLTTLQDFITQLHDLEGNDLISHVDDIQAHLEKIEIDASSLQEIKADIDLLKEVTIQTLPLDQKLEILSTMGAQDLLNLLQELNGKDNLPQELVEILDQLDIESLTIDQLKEALAGNGDPAIVQVVQDTLLVLNSSDIQSSLPQATLNQVNAFLSNHAALVDGVTAKAMSNNLSVIIASSDLSSVERVQIQNIIDRLEAGESINTIDPSKIEQLADKLEGVSSEKLDSVIYSIANVSNQNIIIGADTKAEIENLIQSGGLDKSVSVKIEKALEAGDLAGAIELITQDTRSSAGITSAILTPNQEMNISPKAAIASAVAISQYGAQAVQSVAANFSVPAVSQQLSAIINQFPSNTSMGQAVTNQIQSVKEFVGKLDGANPPSVKELIAAVQNINAVQNVQKLPGAVASQMEAIKAQFVAILPVNVAPKLSGALKDAVPNKENIRGVVNTVRSNVSDRLNSAAKKVETFRQKYNPPANKPSKPFIGPDNDPEVKQKEPFVSHESKARSSTSTEQSRTEENAKIEWGTKKESLSNTFKKLARFDSEGVSDLKQRMESLTKTFTSGCGQRACGSCKACGTALQKAASNLVSYIPGLRSLVNPSLASTAERDMAAAHRPSRG